MGNRRRRIGAGSAEVTLPARGPHRFAMCSRSAQGSPGSGAGTHPALARQRAFCAVNPGAGSRPLPALAPAPAAPSARVRRRCRCRHPGATPRGPGGSWPPRGAGPRTIGQREPCTAQTWGPGSGPPGPAGRPGSCRLADRGYPGQRLRPGRRPEDHPGGRPEPDDRDQPGVQLAPVPAVLHVPRPGAEPVAALVRRPAGHEVSRPSGRRRLGTDPALYLLDRVRYRIADHRDPEPGRFPRVRGRQTTAKEPIDMIRPAP